MAHANEDEISLLREIRDEIRKSRKHDILNGVYIAIVAFLLIAVIAYLLTPQPYLRMYGWTQNINGNNTLEIWFVNSGRAELTYANIYFTLNNATVLGYKNSSNLYVENYSINESFGGKRDIYFPNYFAVSMINFEPQNVGHLAIPLGKNATDVNVTFVDTQAAFGDITFYQYKEFYALVCLSGTCYKLD